MRCGELPPRYRMEMKTKQLAAIVIKEKDNVATAIRELKAGERVVVKVGVEEREVTVRSDIRFLHKLALENIERGQHIIKYGQVIETVGEDRVGVHGEGASIIQGYSDSTGSFNHMVIGYDYTALV